MSVAVLEYSAPMLPAASAMTIASILFVTIARPKISIGLDKEPEGHIPATLSPFCRPFTRIAAAMSLTISLSWRKL